jgi:hypothetical protein
VITEEFVGLLSATHGTKKTTTLAQTKVKSPSIRNSTCRKMDRKWSASCAGACDGTVNMDGGAFPILLLDSILYGSFGLQPIALSFPIIIKDCPVSKVVFLSVEMLDEATRFRIR